MNNLSHFLLHSLDCKGHGPLPLDEDFKSYRSEQSHSRYVPLDWSVSDLNVLTVNTYSNQSEFLFDDIMKWSALDIIKFPHDFTLRTLSFSGEEEMGIFFPFLPRDLAKKTPDICVEHKGVWRIIEFGTKKLSSVINVQEYAMKKREKYRELIETLVSHGIKVTFDVIIVSKSHVYSSLPLSPACVSSLCYRCMLSQITLEEIKRKQPQIAHLLIKRDQLYEVVNDVTPALTWMDENKDRLLSKYKNRCHPVIANPFAIEPLLSRAVDEQAKLLSPPSQERKKIEDLVAPNGRIDHTDTVSRVPLIIPIESYQDTMSYDLPSDLSTLPIGMSHVWNAALANFRADPVSFQCFKRPDPGSTLQEFTKVLVATDPRTKRKRNRFTVPKWTTCKEELALRGLWGKTYKDHSMVQAKRKWSQQHIDSSTQTADIQSFIDEFPNIIQQEEVPNIEDSMRLLRAALPKTNHSPEETFKSLCDNVYVALSFIADIMQELACSAAQSCHSDDFILKKLPKWDTLLVIKPTRSSSHVFFSIMTSINCDLGKGSVFPKGTDIGFYTFYDFYSVQYPLIDSLISLPEKYLACKYNCKGSSGEALMKNLAAGLLIALDNKSDAEEVYTKSRYIYMKGCQMPYSCRKPWDVLDGLPKFPKSRLTLFLMKRCIDLCDRVLSMRCSQLDGEQEEWSNIPNLVSDDTLDNWEEVLLVIYTGYFRNKEAYHSGNQSMAMLEKIVAPEKEFQEDECYASHVRTGNAPDPCKMEWSSAFLEYCIDKWVSQCSAAGLKNVKQIVSDRFIEILSRTQIDELATLKATNIDVEERDYMIGDKNKPRTKLVTLLQREVETYGDSMASALPVALEKISDRGGTMMISLFKKSQHGGLREIYVMDLASRIVQFCIEKLGRIICETLPGEAMSHTDIKMKYRQEHHLKVEEYLNTLKQSKKEELNVITTYDNDDAEKWNQYHHVQKFCFMLQRMTDKRLHSFIQIGLSQWLNKRIRMEDSLLKSMATSIYLPKDAIAQYIVAGFRGVSDNPVARKWKRDLHVETGMMQGLLHFTSSVLHSLSMLGYDALLPAFLSMHTSYLSSQTPTSVKVITTHAITSDDSVVANTVISNAKPEVVVRAYSTACSALKRACGSFLGIVSSKKKSSLCTAPISEFNSQWMDRKEVVRPKMRHILACFTYSNFGNFMEMQDNLSSLRQQALESGVCMHQVSFINYLQGLVFYRICGSQTSAIFRLASDLLITMKDPNAGFFMLDPPIAAGLVNVDFNAYNLAQTGLLAAKYNHCVSNVDALAGCSGSLRSATNMSVEFKNCKKYRELISSVKSEMAVDYVNTHPDLLYRRPRTHEEMVVVLALKLMTPNVLKSLSLDNNLLARQLAASVYLFWAPIVRPNKDVLAMLQGAEMTETKMSIIDILDKEIPQYNFDCINGRGVLTKQAKELFFPLHEQFDMLNDIFRDMEDRVEILSAPKPKCATTVVVHEGKYNDIPLFKLCAFRWFNFRHVFSSEAVLQSFWEEATRIHTFLRPSHSETLEASQLKSAQSLRVILDKATKKVKSIRPTSRGGRSVRSSGLATFISYNFKESITLKVLGREQLDDDVKTRLRRLCMIMEMPLSDTWKIGMASLEINRAKFEDLSHHPRMAPLALMHKNCPRNITARTILKMCSRTDSTIGTWEKRQSVQKIKRQKRWTGIGIWKGILVNMGKAVKVELHVYGNILKSIYTDDLDELICQKVKLLNLLSTWNAKPASVMKKDASTHFYFDFGDTMGTPVYVRDMREEDILLQSDKPKFRVKNNHLQIVYQDVAVFTLAARADLIADGRTHGTALMDYVLNNVPIPPSACEEFICSKHTERNDIAMQEWFIKLLQQKFPAVHFQSDENPVAPFSYDVFMQQFDKIKTSTNFLQLAAESFGAASTFTSERPQTLSITAFDIDAERSRLFEAQSDKHSTITPAHYKFLDRFGSEVRLIILDCKDKGYADSSRHAQLFKILTGEEIEWRTLKVDQDGLDYLNATFTSSETTESREASDAEDCIPEVSSEDSFERPSLSSSPIPKDP